MKDPSSLAVTLPWRELVAPYLQRSDAIALRQLLVTVPAYLCLLALMGLSLRAGYGLTLLLAPLAALLLARCFVLFHDCGHGSLFRGDRANVAAGLLLSLLVWEAFFYWRHVHGVHHATSSHLGRRGTGDFDTWTVAEYRAARPGARLAYRLQREPLVILLLLPLLKFTLYNRLRTRPAPPRAWHSVPLTNLALALVYGGAALAVGWQSVLAVLLPVFWCASLVGLWLFYVQHQFEHAYWAEDGRWTRVDAALRGSSCLRLPRWLEWCTASIGYHHLHHLAPRIPNYRLARCHAEQPLLQQVPTFTLRQSLRSLRCQLWDEAAQRMVSFREAARGQPA